jgi:hypothetical protein
LVSIQNSPVLAAGINALTPALGGAKITCLAGHFTGTSASNGTCANVSYPLLDNDVFFQNRSLYIGIGNLGSGVINQQNVVALYNAFTGTQVASQPSADAQTVNSGGKIITGGTGACDLSKNQYWDIGVRGDTGPTDHTSTITLNPVYSLITAGYNGTAANHNSNSNPTVVSRTATIENAPGEYGRRRNLAGAPGHLRCDRS